MKRLTEICSDCRKEVEEVRQVDYGRAICLKCFDKYTGTALVMFQKRVDSLNNEIKVLRQDLENALGALQQCAEELSVMKKQKPLDGAASLR